MTDLMKAYGGRAPSRVQFDATVTSQPSTFVGRHGLHETFDVASAAGPINIVDNVDIAPKIPVGVGDRIEVRGEMVHDPGRPPVVHWTHHDPSGRHPGGFIRLRDRVYA